jgi:signal peptide peptidase SppA, 36K type
MEPINPPTLPRPQTEERTSIFRRPRPPQQAEPPRSQGLSWLHGCAMSFGLLLFAMIAMVALLVFGLRSAGSSPAAASQPHVLDLRVRGMISLASESTLFSGPEQSAAAALSAIRAAAGDSSVQGILLRLDSGGGEITASDIIYNALKDFKAADGSRSVVVLMESMAASGAYYIACAADKIVAHPTTITGSIGVKIESVNAKVLADKIGVKSVTIASGENKDFLNPLKDLSPEQEALLRKMVGALHERFVTIVTESRGLDVNAVRAIADGRVLLAQEALEAGLIDAIGYEDDAKKIFTEKLGEKPDFQQPRQGIWDLLKSPSFLGQALGKAAVTVIDSAADAETESRLIIK